MGELQLGEDRRNVAGLALGGQRSTLPPSPARGSAEVADRQPLRHVEGPCEEVAVALDPPQDIGGRERLGTASPGRHLLDLVPSQRDGDRRNGHGPQRGGDDLDLPASFWLQSTRTFPGRNERVIRSTKRSGWRRTNTLSLFGGSPPVGAGRHAQGVRAAPPNPPNLANGPRAYERHAAIARSVIRLGVRADPLRTTRREQDPGPNEAR